MARAVPPLTWLRAFEAAGRHLSFTAAAAELSLTQSAVSQHVRSLEARLGTQLFQRKPRGLALTDDGRKLMPQVGTALDMLATATRGFDTRAAKGHVTIATSVSVAQWLIAPNLSRFMAAHPDTHLRIVSTIWPDDFNASIADVEVRFGSAAHVGAGARRLLPDELIVVAAPGACSALDAAPLIEAVGTTEKWQDWARQAGYDGTLTPTIHVDSHGLALDLAQRGVGVALTSSLLAGDALSSGRLVRIGTTALPGTEGYFIATRTDSVAARDLERWLIETCGAV